MAEVEKLLDVSHKMLDSGNPKFLYMACWVARQALEELVDGFVAEAAPDAVHATMRSKLTALTVQLSGTPVPRRAHAAWEQLSHTCHLPAYDLTPTAAEVRGWISDVDELAELYAKLA